ELRTTASRDDQATTPCEPAQRSAGDEQQEVDLRLRYGRHVAGGRRVKARAFVIRGGFGGDGAAYKGHEFVGGRHSDSGIAIGGAGCRRKIEASPVGPQPCDVI